MLFRLLRINKTMKPLLIENFGCHGDVPPRRFVVPSDTTDMAVRVGSFPGTIGVSDSLGGLNGKRVDVITEGTAEIELGATVTRGERIGPDATGRGMVHADIAFGGGRALASGVVGDVILVKLHSN